MAQDIVPCCKLMREHLENDVDERRTHGGIVAEDSGAIHVPGCCGGGCYVLADIICCPWCGQAIVVENGQ